MQQMVLCVCMHCIFCSQSKSSFCVFTLLFSLNSGLRTLHNMDAWIPSYYAVLKPSAGHNERISDLGLVCITVKHRQIVEERLFKKVQHSDNKQVQHFEYTWSYRLWWMSNKGGLKFHVGAVHCWTWATAFRQWLPPSNFWVIIILCFKPIAEKLTSVIPT